MISRWVHVGKVWETQTLQAQKGQRVDIRRIERKGRRHLFFGSRVDEPRSDDLAGANKRSAQRLRTGSNRRFDIVKTETLPIEM